MRDREETKTSRAMINQHRLGGLHASMHRSNLKPMSRQSPNELPNIVPCLFSETRPTSSKFRFRKQSKTDDKEDYHLI